MEHQNVIIQHIGSHETEDRIQNKTLSKLKGWPKDKEGDPVYCGDKYMILPEGGDLEQVGYFSEISDGGVVSIKLFEKVIAKYKKMGATHMTVDFHEDHESYLFDFMVVRLPSEEENKKIIEQDREQIISKKEDEFQFLQNRMNELYNDIHRLKNEI